MSDCALVGGDSGGPLLDLEGRLIGIHSSIGEVQIVERILLVGDPAFGRLR